MQEQADDDSLRSARSKILASLVGEWPPEVHLLAEGEVVLAGPLLTTMPVPRGHALWFLADDKPMAERSCSIRPPPVRETGLAQQTANTVADDTARLSTKLFDSVRLHVELRWTVEEVGPCHSPSELPMAASSLVAFLLFDARTSQMFEPTSSTTKTLLAVVDGQAKVSSGDLVGQRDESHLSGRP